MTLHLHLIILVFLFLPYALFNFQTATRFYLILIKATVLVLLFTLILEGHNNKTYEDIDHEEGNDDDIDDIVNCHHRPVVMYWSHILCVGVYGDIQQSGTEEMGRMREKKGSHNGEFLLIAI